MPRSRVPTMVKPDGTTVPLPRARMDIVVREDGRVERVCREHGVGHPIGHLTAWKDWMGVHGCCGCCYRDGWEG